MVERARTRLGERSYRVLTNNCEHLCAWALRGESRSRQVDRLRAIPRLIRDAIAIAERQATQMWSEAGLSTDERTRA